MKKVMVFLIACFLSIIIVDAKTDKFDMSFLEKEKLFIVDNQVEDKFDKKYNINMIYNSNKEIKDNITNLSKKITYLLLGNSNTKNESPKDYYKRRNDYLKMRYNPKIPKKSGELDKESSEYKDDLVSGISVTGMFNKLDELNIIYNSISSIKVSLNDDMVISQVFLNDVIMKKEDYDNPFNYSYIKADLCLYYYFKKLDNEYKLYYLFLDNSYETDKYNDSNISFDNLSISDIASNKLGTVYDYSILNKITNDQINDIYNKNYKNILMLNSYYNTNLINSANAILISDGVIITTWNFLYEALSKAQFITIKDAYNLSYELDGVVTVNQNLDLAVLKLKDNIKSTINLSTINSLNINSPVISVSNNDFKFNLQKGIITSKDDFIQSSIYITENEQSSPIFDLFGNLISISTSKSINKSLSLFISFDTIKNIKNSFDNYKFSDIKSISFDKLKQEYFYTNYKKEKILKNIPKNVSKEFMKIGNIKDNIKLKLVKSNYYKNAISLRYKNTISNYIDSMTIAASFKDNLLKEGYKPILESDNKSIYTNNKYKVIIKKEFDYLVIVMVKL